MAKGIQVEVFIRRKDGQDVQTVLFDKIVRKIQSLLGRLGCSVHGRWRIGEHPDVEDQLG